MGKLIKGRFAHAKKPRAAKIKAKPSKAAAPDRRKVREYVTITHAAVRAQYPCSGVLKRFNSTFPYREFGVRGIPITPENVLRGMKAGLPLVWTLDHFSCYPAACSYQERAPSSYQRNWRMRRARLAAELLAKHANGGKTKRFYVRGKVQSLKGVKLEPHKSTTVAMPVARVA